MKITLRRWLIALFILLVLAFGVRWFMQRKADAPASGPQAPTSAQLVSDTVTLADADLIAVSERTVLQQVSVSGNVQAVRSAWVKARVAGDLKEVRVKEGDVVTQGQVLARIDDTDARDRHQQAQRQTEMARAQLKTAQLAFDNNQALVNKGFISQTALINSQAALSSAEANLQLALAGERIAQKAVADAVLTAPFSGQVASVAAQTGERANVDAKILEVVDLQQLEVMVSLNPNEASALQLGQTANLQIEGLPNTVQATLQRINPSVDPATRSVRAYLKLPSQAALRQGLFAQGQLIVGQAKGLALPLSAVRTNRPLPQVLRVLEGRVAAHTVELGARGPLSDAPQGETWVMVRGLNAGEAVLAASAGSVREGLKVVRPAATPGTSTQQGS